MTSSDADASSSSSLSSPLAYSSSSSNTTATTTMTTTAVTRSWSDMHTPTWLVLLAVNITARTVVFHPLELAVCRKRVTRESTPPSLLRLLRAAHRGGAASSSSTIRYDLGRGGVRGLYRGVGAALTANLLGEVSFLITLERMKEYLEEECSDNNNQTGSSSSSSSTTTAASVSGKPAAIGAMCADLVALAIATPFVIVANRQMTAAYGMASANVYRDFTATWREMWRMHQPPQPQQQSAAAMHSRYAGSTTRRVVATAARDARWLMHGMRGLYRGTTAGLLRIPSSGCWWALYTKSKAMLYHDVAPLLQRWRDVDVSATRHSDTAMQTSHAATTPRAHDTDVKTTSNNSSSSNSWLLSSTDNPVLNAMAATMASALTTLLFNPLAVIQTRQQALQSTSWQTPPPSSSSSSSSPLQLPQRCRRLRWRQCVPFRRVGQLAVDIAKKEGVRGFFKGAPANIAVSVLDGVVFSLLFELTKLGSDVAFLQNMHASSEATVH